MHTRHEVERNTNSDELSILLEFDLKTKTMRVDIKTTNSINSLDANQNSVEINLSPREGNRFLPGTWCC